MSADQQRAARPSGPDRLAMTKAADPVRSSVSTRAEPGDAELARNSLRRGLTRENFYFVMADRFANGSTRNDKGGLAGDRLATGFDPTDKGFYHGGDLRGIIDKLDYVDGLGTTSIWMTPSFKNRPVQGTGDAASAGYHGYWITDFTQIDPHLGTNAELKELVAKAHARGIKVFFDIITNHTADVIDYAEKSYDYRSKGAYPYLTARGREFDDKDYAGTNRFPRVDLDSFPYTPVFRTAADATVKVPSWLNDRTMYHNRGDSTFSGESSEYGDFFGLDDLWTERPRVVKGMTDIYRTWVKDAGIDGFRIDTVKHVNLEFWQRFAPAVKTYAARQGNKDFFMFGEVFDADPKFDSVYTTNGRLQATLDFPFQARARSFASQSSATDVLRDLFEQDDYYTDADSNAYSLPTFLGNHDMGRMGFFLRQDNPAAGDAELVRRDRLALRLMYLSRGMPVIYYGDEQGFTGDGGDKDARQDMFATKTADYLADDLLGTTATHAQSNYVRSHPLYRSIAKLARLTKDHPALRDGAQIHRLSSDGAGVYAFSRIDRKAQVEYVVALNNAETAKTVSVPTYSKGMTFDRIYPSTGGSVVSGRDRTVELTVPALSAVVLEARRKLATPTAGPAVAIVAPSVDSEVRGRVELRAEVKGTGFNQVTFAAKIGAAEWKVLGTDDNPPYRVFHDVSAIPAKTPIVYKAIVKDSAGRIASARSDAVVGEEPPVPSPGTVRRDYLVIHYARADGNYDNKGAYVFGDVAESELTAYPANHPFVGEDDYGRFTWVKLKPGASNVGFLVTDAKTGEKDCEQDRFVNPAKNPEIWLKSGSCEVYTSRAQAQGYVTFHYNRPDGDYDGWGIYAFGDIDPSEETAWPANHPFATTEDYGRSVRIKIKPDSTKVGYIVQSGPPDAAKDCEEDRFVDPSTTSDVWLKSGTCEAATTLAKARNEAVLHYHRDDGDYGDASSSDYNDYWGLHVWTGAKNPTEWTKPIKPAGRDGFGLYFVVPLEPGATKLDYILHRGDTKDLPDDQTLDLTTVGYEVWILSGVQSYLLPVVGGPGADADLTKAKAIWIDRDTVLWNVKPAAGLTYSLRYAGKGDIAVKDGMLSGGRTIRLRWRSGGLTDPEKAKWSHLSAYSAFDVDDRDLDRVRRALRGQVVAVERSADGALLTATGVQIAGVLDDIYAPAARHAQLGVTWQGGVPTIRVWAPTARTVTLNRYADGATETRPTAVAMRRHFRSGIWSVTGPKDWKGDYYTFGVKVWAPSVGGIVTNEVTDPYSVSLATNSTRSQIVNLRDRKLTPRGWAGLDKPQARTPERSSIYELHLRDFSITDETVPQRYRGTYRAFTVADSAGMRSLRKLAKSGMGYVHLLPVFDIATIEERRAMHKQPPCDLSSYPPDSPEQQECVGKVADEDGFNWGYDPLHYTAPEGSYATDPQGAARVRQFREMVAGLNDSGLRVVMDVVYNHTAASGQDSKSVLDRIVPGYYQRLLEDGTVANSTCCANTAPENAMMGKLVVDSIVTWARDYKVDGFRFDLMGHHPKANILAVRRALNSLTVAKDGVDGRKIYLYGEGWNFGEVADNARFVQATQLNMAGTGIGTFNDRQRDAVRGGGPFDEDPRIQGFGSGLYTDPNASPANGSAEEQRKRLLHYQDLIKVGLSGNLKDYAFPDSSGRRVTGGQVDYNGSPAGYTQDPQEAITYVSAHDNETLFDALAYKLPQATTMADRVRMQALSLSTVALGQGVPFFHAGSERLRSKSLDRNSYNSGDWFNRLNWDCSEGNNFGVGLPPERDNGSKWPYAKPLLGDPALQAHCPAMRASEQRFREFLRIRRSSPLFTLGTRAAVQQRLSFPVSGTSQEKPGVITMHLSDRVGAGVDRRYESVTVVFNAADTTQTQRVTALRRAKLALHPVQRYGRDEVVRRAGFDPGTATFTVPARTVAVFVER